MTDVLEVFLWLVFWGSLLIAAGVAVWYYFTHHLKRSSTLNNPQFNPLLSELRFWREGDKLNIYDRNNLLDYKNCTLKAWDLTGNAYLVVNDQGQEVLFYHANTEVKNLTLEIRRLKANFELTKEIINLSSEDDQTNPVADPQVLSTSLTPSDQQSLSHDASSEQKLTS